jgi:hypothetical protein
MDKGNLFLFCVVEDQSFKTYVQSVWNSQTVTHLENSQTIFLSSYLLNQSFLYVDQTRPLANYKEEIRLLLVAQTY